MESFQRKTITTTRGFTYSYYVSTGNTTRPTLLLLHGFPDDAHLWDGIAKQLTQYNLIIPDLLGYSNTSKPTDPAAYSSAGHSNDLVDILDTEHVEKVISVGHDWGSFIAQRLYLHHPTRVEGLILLALGYILPSTNQPTLEEANAMFEKLWGYPAHAYQEFFISDDAPALLRANIDRFYHAIHGAPRDWTKQIWCQRGEMRKWLSDKDRKVELRGYAQDPAFRQRFLERFQRDGFEAPLCYYKAMYSGVNSDSIKDLDKDRLIVRVPTYYIACTRDPVCRPELSIPAKQGGFLPDWEETIVDSGHWVPFEKPEEVAELMSSFLQKRFSA
ncbi:alpha/beta-hydrolase [Annulohypoxylon truncatum]|uniref:alpha/beta-hydrolase n=1 Tax=Annulohypoxylon truncatum TaxID=327061 RepID=UPI0020075CC2|nr:alpha/beta-hydrolase [Annulohypoxylon truncatum]KAI1204943.1 alpha/beta-hydrolase [Annulohypoxylon truncatum]